MNRHNLNILRRCAGVPQDFSSKPEVQPETVTEDVVPGMSQVLRGGKHKFYLVVEAGKDSDLGDVITEVDIRALANIVRGAGSANTKEWELFPHNKQNDALNLARERQAKVGAEVTEGLAGGIGSRSADSVPIPSTEEINTALDEDEEVCGYCGGRPGYDAGCKECKQVEEQEENFEPATNICPDCEGGEHPPAVGKCERCGGEGEVFEDVEAKEEVVEAEVDESMGYHTVDVNPLTHTDSAQPQNVDTSNSGDTVWDKSEENEEDYEMTDDDQAVKVPSKILSELKRVIGEVTRESEKAKPRDFERANYYEDTAEALQIVYDELAKKTVQGLKQAQYLSQRMMNVQRALMPDSVWKFLVNGGETRSLKSYLTAVKEPVLGKPFSNVAISSLNKNTHTQ